MKSLMKWMLATGIAVMAFACQKDAATDLDLVTAIANSDSKEAITVAELPEAARDYATLSFTPIEIESAWRVRGRGFEVELEDGQDIYFNERGRCLGVGRGGGGGVFRCMRGDTVDVSELPQAAADYVAANYAGATIQTVVYKNHGDRTGYAVELSDGTILLFNAAGEFVTVCGEFGNGHGGPDGPHGGCAAGDTIEVADLPAAITDYLAANYPGESIAVAVVKPSGKFGVELSSGTVLLFRPDGTFIKECDGQPNGGPHHHHCNAPVGLDDLPQAAQDYLAANYPGETVVRGCQKNNGNYIVKLSGGAKILFDADGNMLFDSGN